MGSGGMAAFCEPFQLGVRIARELHQRQRRLLRVVCDMRVLSIQSHVVSGYVGNRAAVFPMQLLGLDVDVLNSCHLSNHTGYQHGAPGHRLTGDDLRATVKGLRDNGLLVATTHVLTGFIGNVSFLHAVADTVVELQKERAGLQYLCDPVLGDNGRLYVPAELIPIYRTRLLPLSTVLTPNMYELGLLADCGGSVATPADEEGALEACDVLHEECGVPLVVVTGVQLPSRPHTVSILCSSAAGERFALDAELLHGRFTGSGDLTAALTLAWNALAPGDLRQALQRVMATVSAVLARTLREAPAGGATSLPELRLVQSRDDILHPPVAQVRVRELARKETR